MRKVASGADEAELERFADLAAHWWDEAGPLAPLHKLNPVRLAYVRDRICAHLGRDPLRAQPLAGLAVLDVGCGGGLLCEPLARLGAMVTGIDPAPASIEAAARHARAAGLAIDYRVATAEQLVAEGREFDLVCAMEVVEHVADQEAFLQACAALVRPGGGLVLATLNRTFRAFALGVVAAEYVLGWLPRGTHRWSRFVRPSEAARALRGAGLRTLDLTGVVYDPLRDRFALSPDPAVNYMLFAAPRLSASRTGISRPEQDYDPNGTQGEAAARTLAMARHLRRQRRGARAAIRLTTSCEPCRSASPLRAVSGSIRGQGGFCHEPSFRADRPLAGDGSWMRGGPDWRPEECQSNRP